MNLVSDDLRRAVMERAGECCEYCLIHSQFKLFSFHVGLVIPERHGGEIKLDNLSFSCVACSFCKSMDIGSLDPETQLITGYYNPRKQKWSEHFQLKGATIEPLTPEGRVMVRMLHLNSPERVQERTLMIQLGCYPLWKNKE